MYAVVDSACLLANAFFVSNCMNEFEMKDLYNVSRKLAKALKSWNVIVDWTRPTLISALEDYGDMFQIQEGRVCRAPESEEWFTEDFIEGEFNYSFSPEVVAKMRTVISEQFHCEV